MQRNKPAFALFCASAAVLTMIAPARASFDTVQTWADTSSVEGWSSNGTTYAAYNGGLENPYFTDGTGFLGIRSNDYYDGSYLFAAAPATYAGNWANMFGTSGNIEFDLKVWSTNSATPDGFAPDGLQWGYDKNNVPYGSMGTGSYFLLYEPSYAGWRYSLSTQGPAAGVVHRTIPFDANWTDAEAQANGWVAGEYGSAPWTEVIANVGTQIQATGFKFMSSYYSTHVAIDNFRPGPELIAGLPGDFNHDGFVNADDIDLLGAEIHSGGSNSLYDVNHDNAVNSDDLSYMVQTILGTYFGDTNLDKQVDVIDLGNLATAWQTVGGWALGDGNADQFIDVVDLGLLATNWQAGVSGPAAAGSLQEALASYGLPGVAVPEPASLGLIGLAAVLGSRRRRG